MGKNKSGSEEKRFYSVMATKALKCAIEFYNSFEKKFPPSLNTAKNAAKMHLNNVKDGGSSRGLKLSESLVIHGKHQCNARVIVYSSAKRQSTETTHLHFNRMLRI